MVKNTAFILFGALMILALSQAEGTEYFLSDTGNDSNSGTSREKAFGSFQRGVNALIPGDTLTVLPGSYYGGAVRRLSGAPDKTISIRGVFPGTVLIHGDRLAPKFKPVSGARFIHRASFSGKVNAVNELDSLTIFARAGTLEELEFKRGAYFHDEKAQQLYVVTSDGKAPSKHVLTVSDAGAFGLFLGGPSHTYAENIAVENLGFRGFNHPESRDTFGIFIRGKNVSIRNCTAFLNGNGIGLGNPVKSLIESCDTYANHSPFELSGGNIYCTMPGSETTVRNCRTFQSEYAGIRLYGGVSDRCLIDRCLSWNNGLGANKSYGGIWIKTASPSSAVTRSVSLEALNSYTESNNVLLYNSTEARPKDMPSNSLFLTPEVIADADANFADPENLDFRPQEGCRHSVGLPDEKNVFFISPNGDDDHSGRSVSKPWRTLKNCKPETTVYFMPGIYPGNLRLTAEKVELRGRGTGAFPVVAGGEYGLEINAPGCKVNGIVFSGQTKTGIIASESAEITRSAFFSSPLAVRSSAPLYLTHNAFVTPVAVEIGGGNSVAHSNIFRFAKGKLPAFFCDYNAYGTKVADGEKHSFAAVPEFDAAYMLRNASQFDGRGLFAFPAGPWRIIRERPLPRIDGPVMLSGSTTSANIEWRSDIPLESTILSGDFPPMKLNSKIFNSVTLTELVPGKTYEVSLAVRSMERMLYSNRSSGSGTGRVVATLRFRTPERDRKPMDFFVSLCGNDENPGSKERPWRHVGYAASKLLPGDTVSVESGEYSEYVEVRSGGTSDKSIVFKAAPGAKVRFHGNKQLQRTAFRIRNKKNITLDGFQFRNFGDCYEGVIQIEGGSGHRLSRLFYDGRGRWDSPPLVFAQNTENLTLSNSFSSMAFHGLILYNCSGLRIVNNLFYMNAIDPLRLWNPAHAAPALISRNIFVSSIPQKTWVPQINVNAAAKWSEEYNCFYLRVPPDQAPIAGIDEKAYTFSALEKLTGKKSTSFLENPELPFLKEQICFHDFNDWKKNWRQKLPECNRIELGHLDRWRQAFRPWDWPDFFPRNPRCRAGADGKVVGPDPKVFEK